MSNWPYLVLVPNFWTWTKRSNPYKIEVIITSHSNGNHWNTSYQTLVTWPHQYNLSHVIKFCWWGHGQKLWHHNLYFKIPFLRRSRVANFADIIKIEIKQLRIKNHVLNHVSTFLDITKVTDFRWKIMMSAKLSACITWFI